MRVNELIKELKTLKKMMGNENVPVIFFSNGYKTPKVELGNAGNDFEDKKYIVIYGAERLPAPSREEIIDKA